MSLFDSLPHKVNVLAPGITRDTGGGIITTYTTRTANVKCQILAPMDSAQERFAQEQLVGNYVLAFKGTADLVYRGDVLEIVSAKGVIAAGVRLRVTGIKYQPAVGSIPNHLHVNAERLV
jgi:hypothetical protein